jgi:hypothetical protein
MISPSLLLLSCFSHKIVKFNWGYLHGLVVKHIFMVVEVIVSSSDTLQVKYSWQSYLVCA